MSLKKFVEKLSGSNNYYDIHKNSGPLLITLGPPCCGKRTFLESLEEPIEVISIENMPNLHSIIPVDIVIGIHNNTIRKQELEELRENFIYSQSLYDRIRDVIDSEQVALLLLFTYRITWEEFQELLQDHHKNDPDTKRDFFAAVEEVLGEFKANGKKILTSSIQIVIPEAVADITSDATLLIRKALKKSKTTVCWCNANLNPNFYSEILSFAQRYGRMVRFIRWEQELPAISKRELITRNIWKLIKTGRYADSIKVARFLKCANAMNKTAGCRRSHIDFARMAGYEMERFGRVRYGSKKFDKYKSHEVTSKWLEWTNSGTVYPVEIVKRGMQRDSGRFLRINNSHDYNNFNDNEEDKCQSATKVSQSYSSSENLRPLSYRSSKSSSFSSRVSSVITGSSHDSDSQNEVLPEVTKSKFAFHSNSNRNSVDNNSSNSALSGHSCHAELTSQLSIKDQVVNETRPVIVLWSMEEEQNDGKSVNNDNYEEGIIKADSITTDNRNTRTSDINTKHETHDNNSNTNLQESNNSCVTVEKVSRNIFYMNITDDKDCDTVGNISYSNSCSYNYSSITEGNSSNSKPPLDPMKRLRQGDSFSTFSHINSIDRFSESEYSDNVSRNNSNSSFQHSNSIDTNISVQTISSNNCTNYPVIIPPVILQRDLSRKLSRRESSEEFDRSPNMCNFMFKG